MKKKSKNHSLASKLLSGFITLVLLGALIGFFGVGGLHMVGNSAKDLYNENILGLTTISNTYAEFQNVRNRLTQLLFVASDDEVADTVTSATQNAGESETGQKSAGSGSQIDKNTALLKEVISTVDRGLEEYKTAATAGTNDEYAALIRDWNTYKGEIEKIVSNVESGRIQEAVRSMLDNIELGDALESDFNDIVAEAKVNAAAKYDRINFASGTAQIMVLIMDLVTLAISIIIARSLTKLIVRPIYKMSVAAEKLSLGDLDIEIETNKTSEISRLSDAFQALVDSTKAQAAALVRLANGDMTANVAVRSDNDVIGKSISELVSKMRNLIMNIKTASHQVAEGAAQISASSDTLSGSASEQASVVEELTATIEEISSHTTNNVAAANAAKDLAISAKTRAEQGNIQMDQLMNAMAEIRDSSQKVSNVVKIIEEIAFQTNILALNAAVEASRAGAAGKGFAVVAEEVKNLAQRSATAANETTDTIQVSIRKAAEGEKVAQATYVTFGDIVKDIEKAAEAASGIAAASADQAHGIQQINQGILQVSDLAQTTAATAEEEAAASRILSDQADSLRDLLGDFTI